MNEYLNGIIERLEESSAVIILENNQKIVWPKNKIPQSILKEGQAIKISILSDQKSMEKQEQLAKDLLNELLADN